MKALFHQNHQSFLRIDVKVKGREGKHYTSVPLMDACTSTTTTYKWTHHVYDPTTL